MGSEAMKLGWMPTTEDMPQRLQAAKRTNIYRSEDLDNWWMGHGKDESCFIEGTANHWFWLAFTLIGLTKADECPYSEDAPLPYSKDYVCDAVKNAAAKDAEIERLKRAMDLRHKDAMKLVDLHTKLESENERLKAQLAAMGQQAGNVLARIHGDGGHYITQHGWEKACVDADAVVCRLQAQLAASEEKRKVRVVLRSESKYVGMKILNWDTDAPILANPSKYETLRPGQSLVIMEADATDAASALEAP